MDSRNHHYLIDHNHIGFGGRNLVTNDYDSCDGAPIADCIVHFGFVVHRFVLD